MVYPPPEVAEKGATSHFFQTLQQTKVINFSFFYKKKRKSWVWLNAGDENLP